MNKTCNVTRMLIFNPIKTGFGNPILPMGLSVQWLPWFISHSSHNTTHETFNTQLTAQYTQHNSQHMHHTAHDRDHNSNTSMTHAICFPNLRGILWTSSKVFLSFYLSICLPFYLSDILLTFWTTFVLITKQKTWNFFLHRSSSSSIDMRTYRAAGQPTKVVQNVNRMSER